MKVGSDLSSIILIGVHLQYTVSQMVSLVTHGNYFLGGGNLGSYWPSADIFRSCGKVNFVKLLSEGDSNKEIPYAEDPLQWFAKLDREKVIALRIHYIPTNRSEIPDWHAAAFLGGGGRWIIEALKSLSVSDIWDVRWRNEKKNTDGKSLFPTYGRTTKDFKCDSFHTYPEERALSDLKEALEKIEKFAIRVGGKEYWVERFRLGLLTLNSDNPQSPKNASKDLAPDGILSLGARRLLACAQVAWVFGGMGWWNDQVFKGEDEVTNERVSDNLFKSLNRAIVAGANSSCRKLSS